MAKKQRERIGNSRPRYNRDTDTISNKAQEGSSSASFSGPADSDDSGCSDPGSSGGGTSTINNVVKHSIHEVGQDGSSFPGTDTYGRDMDGATFATREKLYHRYDLIEGIKESGLVDEDGFPLDDADVNVRQYVYDNPTLERRNTSGSDLQTVLIRKTEDQSVLLHGYDEKYFQHIFSWPTSHTLKTRKIAGFLELETVKTETSSTAESEPGAGDGTSCSKSSTSYNMIPVERDYDVNFTLTDVTAEIYQPNPEAGSKKGDKVWNYNQLTFDAITGKLQNKNQGIRDKLGDPIIYYGDHTSDAVFFNYLPDVSNFTSVITHDFDDDSNTDNNFTVSGNINVIAKNRGDTGGDNDSKNRKHYDITFPKDIVSTGNIRIHFNERKTASGKSRSRLYVSKLKQVGDRKIRVWFQTEEGNTFARSWTASIGGGETGTSNVVSIGDTINGATVNNVVNYVEEVALLRMVVKQPKKGVEDKKITEATFLALTNSDGLAQNLTAADYAGTRSWVKLNDVRDIIKGMDVQGRGIKHKTTTVTGVDYVNSIVYLTDTVRDKKLKNVKFIDDACNRVSKHTLCYARLDSPGNFSIDADYPVVRNGQTTNIAIKARAGKGITNRSAVVGTWFSEVKHEIEYQPIFYGSNFGCEREIDSDAYGEYTLGTIIWDNNSRLEGKYLLTNPTTEFAYTVSSIWFSFTYAPIDQTTFYLVKQLFDAEIPILNQTMDTKDKYKIFLIISDLFKEFNLKALAVFDDVCRDDIKPDYFNMYDPIQEQNALLTNTDTLSQTVIDACSVQNEILTQQSIDQSYVLPQLYKEKFDTLLTDLRDGYKLIENARPTINIEDLPPQIVGEDQSGRMFTASSFRQLPPSTDRVGYFSTDLIINDDKYLNPILDLDPQTTINQPKIIIRSKPRWVASNSGETWTISVASEAGPLTTSMSVTVNNSGGHVGNITTSSGAGDSNTITTTVGEDESTTTCTISWVPLRSKTDSENEGFCTRNAFPNVYTISTNVALPPGGNHNDSYARTDLRDLNYRERPKDPEGNYKNDMLSLPTHAIYPAIVWEPAVNYQQDFHKTFEFRLLEHSDLIGETIENKGNPYVDDAITATLTKKLEISDTSILVQSTGEFLSSGYLIIPKYVKKIVSLESGTNNGFYTYSGEEIIYYGSKTETSFDNIERGKFNTTSSFEDVVSVESVEKGVRYKIESLGSSNWKKIGAGKNPKVGDVFKATKHDGVGDGTVTVFGTTKDETPDETLIAGVIKIPKEAVITSYDKGFSIAQHSVFSLKY